MLNGSPLSFSTMNLTEAAMVPRAVRRRANLMNAHTPKQCNRTAQLSTL